MPTQENRLSSLDYLRGLAAFGIMVFHYCSWSFGWYSAQDFLGRLGIYGVAIFYVLSGLTLYHVYYPTIGAPSVKGLKQFAVKRLFRIIPLLWLLTAVTLILGIGKYDTKTILLNFSCLFSVTDWQNSICYGAWSIGNELVFYLFFPVFIWLSKRSRILFATFSLFIFICFLWFAFVRIDSTKTLGEHFADYTNPLNQVFFFLAGFILAHVSKKQQLNRYIALVGLLLCVVIFVIYPVKGDSVLLITGFNRLVFTAISCAVCYIAYKTDFGLKSWLNRCLQTLGEISFSVYLVHPIVWHVLYVALGKRLQELAPIPKIAIGMITSLIVAYVVYRFFERYFMKLGKRVVSGMK